MNHQDAPKCAHDAVSALRRADHLSDVKKWRVSAVKTFERAYSGKSRPSGVKAFCIECQGFEDPAETVRTCTAYACPLWEYRPYRGRRK